MKKDYFFLALGNLKHRGLRSWLTILGIFIGITAVVALISLGQGLQDGIERQFEQLGKDKIIIQSKTIGPPGSATSEKLILTSGDLEIIQKTNGVEQATGVLVKTSVLNFKDEVKVNMVIGINPSYLDLFSGMEDFKVIEGRDLKEGDKFKAVIGYNNFINGKIWEEGIKIGDTIKIEETDFKVVGILGKT